VNHRKNRNWKRAYADLSSDSYIRKEVLIYKRRGRTGERKIKNKAQRPLLILGAYVREKDLVGELADV